MRRPRSGQQPSPTEGRYDFQKGTLSKATAFMAPFVEPFTSHATNPPSTPHGSRARVNPGPIDYICYPGLPSMRVRGGWAIPTSRR